MINSFETQLFTLLQGFPQNVPVVEPPAGQVVQPVYRSFAPEGNQSDFFFFPRLKPDGSAGRDIQPESEPLFPVERQTFVHFEKMKMRTDLDRPVPRIFDPDGRCLSAFVQNNMSIFL